MPSIDVFILNYSTNAWLGLNQLPNKGTKKGLAFFKSRDPSITEEVYDFRSSEVWKILDQFRTKNTFACFEEEDLFSRKKLV